MRFVIGGVRASGRLAMTWAALLVLLLTACSSTGTTGSGSSPAALVAWVDWRSERPPTTTVRMDQEEKLAFRQQQLLIHQEYLEETYGIEVEIPDLIRWTLHSESPSVWVRCLNESGWEATLVEGGGILFPQDLSQEQRPAYSVAEFTCIAQYFRDPNHSQTLTQEQYGVIHDYWLSWMMPCIEGQGYGFSGEIPTREAFVASAEPFGWWDPFFTITKPHIVVESSEEAEALQRACPRWPPDEALWPS